VANFSENRNKQDRITTKPQVTDLAKGCPPQIKLIFQSMLQLAHELRMDG